MTRRVFTVAVDLQIPGSLTAAAQPYSVQRSGDVVRLDDAASQTTVSVATAVGFEPMAAVTDALNLAHRGVYKDLQSIPPGQAWQESFWVRPSGF